MPWPIGLRPYGSGAPAAVSFAFTTFWSFGETPSPPKPSGKVHPREPGVVLRAEHVGRLRGLRIVLGEELVAAIDHELLVSGHGVPLFGLDRPAKPDGAVVPSAARRQVAPHAAEVHDRGRAPSAKLGSMRHPGSGIGRHRRPRRALVVPAPAPPEDPAPVSGTEPRGPERPARRGRRPLGRVVRGAPRPARDRRRRAQRDELEAEYQLRTRRPGRRRARQHEGRADEDRPDGELPRRRPARAGPRRAGVAPAGRAADVGRALPRRSCAPSSATIPRACSRSGIRSRSRPRRSGRCTAPSRTPGSRVAVKVQYPGVDDAIRADLVNTDLLFRVLGMMFPGLDPGPARRASCASASPRSSTTRSRPTTNASSPTRSRGHPFISVPTRDRRALDRARAHDRARGRARASPRSNGGRRPNATSRARPSTASCSAASTSCTRSTATRIPATTCSGPAGT